MSSEADLAREIALIERVVDANRRQLIAAARDCDGSVRLFARQLAGSATAFAISACVGALLMGPRRRHRGR